jgi:hypothetical protein
VLTASLLNGYCCPSWQVLQDSNCQGSCNGGFLAQSSICNGIKITLNLSVFSKLFLLHENDDRLLHGLQRRLFSRQRHLLSNWKRFAGINLLGGLFSEILPR